jgi:hypothetical protein
MLQYRIYSMNDVGHISAPSENIECADDQEAIQKAQQAVNGSDIELWEGDRLIVRFPRDDPRKKRTRFGRNGLSPLRP